MVNAAMAEGLKHMCDEIDSGKEVDQVIRETITEYQGVLFSGNGYSPELYDFAEKNELIHLKSSPEAYLQLTSDKNIKLFTDLKIFNEREIHARRNVLLEAFATDLSIEARTLLNILQTRILPVAIEDADLGSGAGLTSKFLSGKRELVQALLSEIDKLSDAFDNFPDGDPEQAALYAQETIKPVMESARAVADQLEGVVDWRLWPFPNYSEILHDHQ